MAANRTTSAAIKAEGNLEVYQSAKGVEALAVAGVCIALGIVLSVVIHPLGISPRIILPMHFPVFLAGMLLGPLHAAMVGVMTPILSTGLAGMPTVDQTLRMMPELAAYGLVTSLVIRLLPRIPGLPKETGRLLALEAALLLAMIAGRLVYVLLSMAMTGITEMKFYATVLLLPAIPGIIAQFILVPPLALKLQKATSRGHRGA